MARQILLRKTKNIRSSGFFTVIADEVADISNKELMSICARWIRDDLKISEDFRLLRSF